MNYKFNVNITQDDFFEFNKVVMFETQMGKKLLKLEKLFFALFCLIFALVVLVKYSRYYCISFTRRCLFWGWDYYKTIE